MAGDEELPMLIVFGKSVNPELEEIRDSVPQPPPVDEDVEELVRATSRLHVGFLFTAKGLPALQQISRFVLSAEEYAGGWREFAAHLGLDPVAVQCMRNSGNMTRVCELTLEAFAQKEDASLDQVVMSFHRMNRVDAICQCKSSLLELVDAVLKERDQDHNVMSEDDQGGLIIPSFLPEVAVMFRNLSAIQDVPVSTARPGRQDMEQQQERYEEAVAAGNAQPEDELQEYAYLVMLTFASDGEEAARRIANIFRQMRSSDGHRVGVVILQEHSFRIATYGSQYVLGFFNDVDYVVPVVTQGYVDLVLEHGSPLGDRKTSSLDHKYARYVYQQMQAEYLLKNCVNARVRPVIVDGFVRQAQREFIMGDALFQSWCSESDVTCLAERLLLED